MDYLTKKEVQGLANDIKAKENALEAEKYIFERKLRNGLGQEIINKLNNPEKPSLKLSFKLKIIRWFNTIKEKYLYKRNTLDCNKF